MKPLAPLAWNRRRGVHSARIANAVIAQRRDAARLRTGF